VYSRTRRSFEIILVDGGRPDGTRGKIAAAAVKNPGSMVGVFLNRNFGRHAVVLVGLAQSMGATILIAGPPLKVEPREEGISERWKRKTDCS
jgi:glycosyltransferase involved in cell wall biosynthesis